MKFDKLMMRVISFHYFRRVVFGLLTIAGCLIGILLIKQKDKAGRKA